jgi:hypothetical protein
MLRKSFLRRLFLCLCLAAVITTIPALHHVFLFVSGFKQCHGTLEPSRGHFDNYDKPIDTKDHKTLILYSYYEPRNGESSGESNTDAGLARRNLEFFVQHGVLGPHAPSSEKATFVFIINGGYVSVALPQNLSHVNVLRRENSGLEFCGYSRALERYREDMHQIFLFLNGSVRGPYLPNYLPLAIPWNYLFENLLDGTVKLVGVSINCVCCKEIHEKCKRCSDPDGLDDLHLQSFLFATDKLGLQLLLPLIRCHDSKVEAISEAEIGMSRRIRKAGYNLASMDKFWFHHDFNNQSLTLDMCQSVAEVTEPHRGDTQFLGAYFGMDHNPYESLFIKTNRGESQSNKLYTRWSTPTVSRAHCVSADEVECATQFQGLPT